MRVFEWRTHALWIGGHSVREGTQLRAQVNERSTCAPKQRARRVCRWHMAACLQLLGDESVEAAISSYADAVLGELLVRFW